MTIHSLPDTHPEFDRQLALEEEMRSRGIDRYWRNMNEATDKGSMSETQVGNKILTSAHEATLAYLKEFISKIESEGSGKNGISYKILSKMDLDLAVHLALRVVLDQLAFRPSFVSCALDIANFIEDELHYQALKEQKKYAFAKAAERAKKSPSKSFKRRTMRETANKVGVEFTGFTQSEKVHLGTKLLDAIENGAQNLMTVDRLGVYEQHRIIIHPTLEAWLKDHHEKVEWMSPLYLPTIIPPKPWTTPFDGGYWSGRVRRLTVVKQARKGFLERLAKMDLTQVYAALNGLQNTAWRINPFVFNTMSTMWTLGVTINDDLIPSPDKKELPKKPDFMEENPDLKYEAMTEEQQKLCTDWKREAAQVYDYNAGQTVRRLQFERMYDVAQQFVDEPAIYFPHNLDFRGRMYPVPLFLNPQGSDSCKALLMFAEGKPLGDDDAVKWLASHGAAAYGKGSGTVDWGKQVFAERLRLVKAHQPEILASAEDPLSNTFWTTAEEPWLFLAFCEAWAGYVREGLSYVCHLPVQMDGSCNGLQHFSAMLRDPVGGRSVNLTDTDPQDIYTDVMEAAKAIVARNAMGEELEHPEDQTHALAWTGHIDRSTAKRPTMTLSYGASKYGFTDQVYKDKVTVMKMKMGDAFPFQGTGYLAAQYMGRTLYKAMGESLSGAQKAMEALQGWGSAVSKAQGFIEWTTPSGFLVHQEYVVPKTKRIQLAFGDKHLYVSVREDEKAPKPDHQKNRSAISPNVVHSLDATHMVFTLNAAIHQNISSFSMIHDSYGTHAADAERLNRTLKEQFVRLYTDYPVLDMLRETCMAQAGHELDVAPNPGTLDLANVLKAQYFFA